MADFNDRTVLQNFDIVAAIDKNGVIGLNGSLPWHLPADLAFFKQLTIGHTVIMGRKTFEAIGKPLPGRKNVVITRNYNYYPRGCIVVHSIREALSHFSDEKCFIIGGSEIFQQFLPYTASLYITLISHEFEGDTFFPEIDSDIWYQEYIKEGTKDERNPYTYYFTKYNRNNMR